MHKLPYRPAPLTRIKAAELKLTLPTSQPTLPNRKAPDQCGQCQGEGHQHHHAPTTALVVACEQERGQAHHDQRRGEGLRPIPIQQVHDQRDGGEDQEHPHDGIAWPVLRGGMGCVHLVKLTPPQGVSATGSCVAPGPLERSATASGRSVTDRPKVIAMLSIACKNEQGILADPLR